MNNVLITGAGIGIGRATALAFAHAGYHVFVSISSPPRASKSLKRSRQRVVRHNIFTLMSLTQHQ